MLIASLFPLLQFGRCVAEALQVDMVLLNSADREALLASIRTFRHVRGLQFWCRRERLPPHVVVAVTVDDLRQATHLAIKLAAVADSVAILAQGCSNVRVVFPLASFPDLSGSKCLFSWLTCGCLMNQCTLPKLVL